MKRLTREWVRKAEDDYQFALMPVPKGRRFHDQRCFHCQQSAEKYLKALIEELGRPVTRIHNLIALLPILAPSYPELRSLRRGLDFLTRFAVGVRYPGESASKRQTDAALRWAARTRDACRAILGLPA
jgi:HEPN domain-containing protein